MDNRKYLPIIIGLIVVAIVIVALSSSLFYTVQAGERAVIFHTFGGGLDKENVVQPGFNMKAPWDYKFVYNVKENTAEESMDVLDKNGLSIFVDVTIRYNPLFNEIGYLHEEFGEGYESILVKPEVRSAVRQVMGRYSAEEIYSTKRQEVEATIKSETEKILAENHIKMNALLIRSIKLPDQIRTAIENKLEQEQEALAYQYRLEREKSEAERKRIAAEGEAQANDIVNKSLTDKLLKMRGIEATQQLANSQNSKVVVIGQGDGGLPLILGGN